MRPRITFAGWGWSVSKWESKQTIRLVLECDHEPNVFAESDALQIIERLTDEMVNQINEILPRGFKVRES